MSMCLMRTANQGSFKSILDQFPVSAIVAGFGDGSICYMNTLARELFQTKDAALASIKASDFYVDPSVWKKFIEEIISSRSVKDCEIEFQDGLGARFWGIVSSTRIDYDGNDSILLVVIDITERKIIEKDLLQSSQYDFLTGVFNRRHFVNILNLEVVRAKRHGHELSIIMIDADNFKKINDNHGHVAGDHVLKWLCFEIKSSLRQTDVFGRIGGEEFAVLLPETGASGATKLAERIRVSIEKKTFYYKFISLNITISLGISSLSEQDDGDSLFKRSDDALLEAKSGIKNHSVFR